MLLTRFWSVLLTLALGAAVGTLFLAQAMYNRAGKSAREASLLADSSAVEWYLHEDSRTRAAELIRFALSPDVGAGLAKATGDAKIDDATRAKVKAALAKLAGEVRADLKFDAVWAVDANGRIVANVGFDHREDKKDWELGGYASVADAVHGWIRDDAWVWGGKVYRVVTRPVEREAQGEPVGAIIGAKKVDDSFARGVTGSTGAAVGFYVDGVRVASAVPTNEKNEPVEVEPADLDLITADIKGLDGDKDYQQKGRSKARVLGQRLGVVYARLPGEAWELGAGYAVGHLAIPVATPADFLTLASKADQEKVPTKIIIGAVALLATLGLAFSFLEHNRPLSTFRAEVQRLAEGKIDVLSPSRFRGAYKKIAADLNDGIEKVAVKGGAPRRAADLEQVLGPIPAQPSMSAFSVPGGSAPGPTPEPPTRSAPKPPPDRSAPRLRSGQSGAMPAVVPPPETEPGLDEVRDVRFSAPVPEHAKAPPPVPKRPPAVPAVAPAPPTLPAAQESSVIAIPAEDQFDELADWRRVYEEFLALKRQCGEDTASLTFEKFKGTLQRNKEALVQRHNCTRVKFTVYAKEGKAALKASPVK